MRLLLAITMIVSCSAGALATDLGLIDAATLNRNPSRWVVLDARPKSEWEAGHIPGARSFSWENYTRTDEKGVQYRVFPPEELAIALAGLGIDEKTPVVIYGDADKSWGGEGWDAWVLSWLGHKGPIRLLNGGTHAWRSRDLPLTKGVEKPAIKKSRYQVNLKQQLDISTEELERQKGSLVLIDVRSTLEWLRGRIPGAIHIPWDDFYSGKERRPLTSGELKKLLAGHGVDTTKPIVYYCLGGIRSSYAWLTHELAGLPAARNYEGGMAAWQRRAVQ
jgi:thiosulfate/3-mercaptopyruvate sulfurtransferase